MFGLTCDWRGEPTGADAALIDAIDVACQANATRVRLAAFEENAERVRSNDPGIDRINLADLSDCEQLRAEHVVMAGAALSGNAYVTSISCCQDHDEEWPVHGANFEAAFRSLLDGIRVSLVTDIDLAGVAISDTLKAEVYSACLVNSLKASSDASCNVLVCGNVGNDSSLLKTLPAQLHGNTSLFCLNAFEFSGLRSSGAAHLVRLVASSSIANVGWPYFISEWIHYYQPPGLSGAERQQMQTHIAEMRRHCFTNALRCIAANSPTLDKLSVCDYDSACMAAGSSTACPQLIGDSFTQDDLEHIVAALPHDSDTANPVSLTLNLSQTWAPDRDYSSLIKAIPTSGVTSVVLCEQHGPQYSGESKQSFNKAINM
jgi:hypothetical protein